MKVITWEKLPHSEKPITVGWKRAEPTEDTRWSKNGVLMAYDKEGEPVRDGQGQYTLHRIEGEASDWTVVEGYVWVKEGDDPIYSMFKRNINGRPYIKRINVLKTAAEAIREFNEKRSENL